MASQTVGKKSPTLDLSGAELLELFQRCLDAAGIHDADPRELPDRIFELRFFGSALHIPGSVYPISRQAVSCRGTKERSAEIIGLRKRELCQGERLTTPGQSDTAAPSPSSNPAAGGDEGQV